MLRIKTTQRWTSIEYLMNNQQTVEIYNYSDFEMSGIAERNSEL